MSTFIQLKRASDVTVDLARTIAHKDSADASINLLCQLEHHVVAGDGAARVVLLLAAIVTHAPWMRSPLQITFTHLGWRTKLDLFVTVPSGTPRIGRQCTYNAPLSDFIESAVRITGHPHSRLKMHPLKRANGTVTLLELFSIQRTETEAAPVSLAPASLFAPVPPASQKPAR